MKKFVIMLLGVGSIALFISACERTNTNYQASLPANAPTTASPARTVAPTASALPPIPPPAIAAKAAVLLDADDGRILYSLNPNERLPMGSTTKMMTALIVVEDHVENHDDLNAIVTASRRAAALSSTVGDSSIDLQVSESLTLEQMLYGMLLPSGDDAAVALAEYDAGSVEAFANKMNQKAEELGLTNTHYTNPHGLDDPGHYTSALDNAKLGTEVMKHEEIRKIVDTYQITIPGVLGPRHLVNTNDLLRTVSYIDGIKTGSTDAAGECIVVSADKNGVHLIFSYLGGPSLAQRDRDVMKMLAYGFAQYGVTTENGPPRWQHRGAYIGGKTDSEPARDDAAVTSALGREPVSPPSPHARSKHE